VAVLAVGLAAAARMAAAPPAPDVEIAARAFTPGELIVLTIATGAEASKVGVDLFGRHTAAYRLSPTSWQAVAGIDLDQQPGRYMAVVDARIAEATVHASREVIVTRRVFPQRKLRVDPDFVNPPQAVLARIEEEAVFVRHAMSASAGERLWSAPFQRPVPDPANSRFGTRSIYNGEPRRPHAGADFLSAAGTPVKAPNAGRVVAARDLYFTGQTVIIDHGLGLVTLLAHLSSMEVREGETVKAGQVVGRVGATGRVTGAHLHWALTAGGARVDPLSALALLGEQSSRPPR